MHGLAGQRVLVTGGSGFIGRSVVAGLRGAGAQVRIADKVPPKGMPDDVEVVLGDLLDPEVRDAAVTSDLAGIVHLAAVTSVLGSLADPAGVHEINVDVTAGLLELARRRGVARFVMASTNAVTGDIGTGTIHEGLPLRPLTPYGATKAAAEMLLSGYAGGYGMITCALRLTNVYGPGMELKDSFVPRLMRAAMTDTTDPGVRRRPAAPRPRARRRRRGRAAASHGRRAARRAADHRLRPLRHGARHRSPASSGSPGRPIAREHVPAKTGEMPAVIVSHRPGARARLPAERSTWTPGSRPSGTTCGDAWWDVDNSAPTAAAPARSCAGTG